MIFQKELELDGQIDKLYEGASEQFKRDRDYDHKDANKNSIKIKFGSWWSYRDDKRGTADIKFHDNKVTIDFSFLGEIIAAVLVIYLPILLVVTLSALGSIYIVTIPALVILLIFLKYHHSCFYKTADKYSSKIKDILYIVGSDEFKFCENCGNKVNVNEDWGVEKCPVCGTTV